MNYLDQTGLEYLWGKIKTYVGIVIEGGVGEIVVNWDDVKGKPSTFTPSTHTHTVSQITDFPTNIVTNVTISGSGNAVTNASFSDNTLTITKGTIEGGGITEVTSSNLSDDLKNQIVDANNIEMAYGSGPERIFYDDTEQPSGDWIGIYTESLGSTQHTTYIPAKTINRQSIFGTGNIDTSYTSGDYAYSAGQFELQLHSTHGVNTLGLTCPFEYSDLAGTPTFKTVNGQSIIGSGDITVQGGSGGDGNYYPTAFELSNNRDQLIGTLRMSGTSDITANGPHFATINGVHIIGSEQNIIIDWDNLQRKPSWAEDGITWDDIGDQPSMVNDVHVSGSGNAVVDASYQGGMLTLTKGTISAGTSGITQSEADGRYVNVSGDTMTGDLNVTGHTVNAQTVDVTNVEALQINISGNTNNNAINVNNGGVTAKAFYESSDISLKENIAPITKEATDAVDCLTFKQFNFKDDKDKTTKYGVVAQEVEAAGLSNLVSANEEGVKSVDYISLLILKIEALEKRIAELEAERR